MPVGAAQVGPADLSKTELHTEAPMTQLGRTAASGSSIDHVWFVSSSVICCFGKYAAIGSIVDHIRLVPFIFPTVACVEENMKDDRQRTM